MRRQGDLSRSLGWGLQIRQLIQGEQGVPQRPVQRKEPLVLLLGKYRDPGRLPGRSVLNQALEDGKVRWNGVKRRVFCAGDPKNKDNEGLRCFIWRWVCSHFYRVQLLYSARRCFDCTVVIKQSVSIGKGQTVIIGCCPLLAVQYTAYIPSLPSIQSDSQSF